MLHKWHLAGAPLAGPAGRSTWADYLLKNGRMDDCVFDHHGNALSSNVLSDDLSPVVRNVLSNFLSTMLSNVASNGLKSVVLSVMFSSMFPAV
jgi:hypothetical protein